MQGEDELHHTDTHSSTQKMVQPQKCQVHCESEDKASSQLEESESASQQQNITIFSPEMEYHIKEPQFHMKEPQFQMKQPQSVGRPPRIQQEESEDEEMHQAEEPVQKPEGEEAEVSQIINAFNFATVFQAKALKPRNVVVLKRALKKHLKEAAKIKRILRKLNERVLAESSSDESSEQRDFEEVSRKAMNSYMEGQNK